MSGSQSGDATLHHRDDLQGLRAVAVLLVVFAHAGVHFLQGGYVGVDVFFVLSGYLITGLLLTGAEKTGRVSLTDFYQRRARRILPAAALTLVVTDVAAWLLLNFVRAKEVVVDSLWASGFAANIHFARENSDYFAHNRPVSPLQHFWTLSVEEQFYLAWPLVLGLLLFGALTLRGRRSARGVTKAALLRALLFIGAAGAVSLAWSIHWTTVTPLSTYFSTFARAWELALGAALAIAAPRLRRLPGAWQSVLGTAGLVCVGLAAVTFSSHTAFPGYAALLPTLGAALVIAGGIPETVPKFSAHRLLSLAPFRYVGDRSYAFYLWHWPVLILAAEYAGRGLSVWRNLLLVCGAFVLSIASYAMFENPIRHMRFRRPAYGLLLWPAALAAVLVFALPIMSSIDAHAAALARSAAAYKVPPLRSTGLGRPLPAVVAAARAAERGDPIPSPLVPAVSQLESDIYHLPNGCVPTDDAVTSSAICRLGDTSSARTLVVMGDSHAHMWVPAVLRMAKRDHWLVIPIIKPGCTAKEWLVPGPKNCDAWFQWAIGQVQALRPTATLVIAKWSRASPSDATHGVGAAVTAFSQSSTHVVVLGDPIGTRKDAVECLLSSGATMRTCSPPPRKTTTRTNRAVARVARHLGAGFMDNTGWFCASPGPGKAAICPLVINHTIVRRDNNHVSETYALELSRAFRALFRATLAGT